MAYTLELAGRARKQLDRLPPADLARILAVLRNMEQDPFSGDVRRLTHQRFGWRRRVGAYRILYDLDPSRRLILVARIERRTSTTYG